MTVAARGASRVEDVWRAYSTPARWHEWSPQIVDVECPEPSVPVETGRAGVVRGPLGARVTFSVTDVDTSAHRWTWQVRTGLLTLTMQHGVDGEDGAARAWVRITGPLPVVLGYAPAARVALARLVAPRRGR